jgi:hypothetical protein
VGVLLLLPIPQPTHVFDQRFNIGKR